MVTGVGAYRDWGGSVSETLYRHFGENGGLLYVGVSNDPILRTKQHSKTARWWEDVEYITLEKFPDRDSALRAESRAIISERPRYNIAGTTGVPRPPRVYPRPQPNWPALNEQEYMRTIDLKTASTILGLSPGSISKAMKSGDIHAWKIGIAWRTYLGCLVAWYGDEPCQHHAEVAA